MKNKIKLASEFVTSKYLQILDEDYIEFLLAIKFANASKTEIIDNEFIQDDCFSLFAYKNKTYDVCFRQGKINVGSMNKFLRVPLPVEKDSFIKNISRRYISWPILPN